MICMIAVGIRNPESIVHPTVETDLVTGFTAAANIAFSYGKKAPVFEVEDFYKT